MHKFLKFSFFLMLMAVSSASLAEKKATQQFATIKTNMGEIVVELDIKNAPLTTRNFMQYVREDAYNNTIFHRIIDGFMIQGGGYSKEDKELPSHKPVKNEASNGLSNMKGTIAMARLANPHSATRQFFINLVDNKRLDYPAYGGGYTVFGKVVKGLDTVEKIGKIPVSRKLRFANYPQESVYIIDVELTSTLN